MENKKLLIVDLYTGSVSYLKNKFPKAKITVLTPKIGGKRQDDHGHQMAECALMACPDLELYLCHHDDNWLDRRIELGRCNASISMGWDFTDLEDNVSSKREIKELLQVKKQVQNVNIEKLDGGNFFFSAGNSDESTREKPELENDLATPQDAWYRISNNIHIIGACSARGVPSLFSSDDSAGGVDVAYVGENINVYSPSHRRIVNIAGTSPATAFAAGHMTKLNMKYPKEYWRSHARLAKGWKRGDRHRKMGCGAMLYEDFLYK